MSDRGHITSLVSMDVDISHFYTCDWNLYPEDRPNPTLCNRDCLARPDRVEEGRLRRHRRSSARWARALLDESDEAVEEERPWTRLHDGSE